MSKHLAFKKFEPQEDSKNYPCIWCGQNYRKNKAHILSRKILKFNAKLNTLTSSVCEQCNSEIGSKIEDFLFKKTPLGYLADLFLRRELKSLKWIPNYFWNSSLQTWIIVVHDKNAKQILPSQVILDFDGKLAFLSTRNNNLKEEPKKLTETMKSDIDKGLLSIHESDVYPENFLPRAFYLNEKLILTAINSIGINKLITAISDSKIGSEYAIASTGGNRLFDKYQIKFQWDLKTYFDYCAKVAFEFFCLIAGKDVCLEKGFNELRETVMGYRSNKPLEITYTENESSQAFSNKLVPKGWISYTDVDMDIILLPLVDDNNNLNHTIFLYELENGLVCATVKLFNIDATQLILGKRKAPLKFRAWVIQYNTTDSKLTFFKSVTEKAELDNLRKKIPNKLLENKSFTYSPTLWLKAKLRQGQ